MNHRLASIVCGAAAAAVALAVAPRSVGAEPPATNARTSSLSWVRTEGAESCIASKELAEKVERIVGRPLFVSASDAELSVEGRVERAHSPEGWRAVVRIAEARGAVVGTRELDAKGESCRALDDSVAFVIAVMIDPDAERRSRPAPPSTSSTPPAASPPPPAANPFQIHASAGVEVASLLPSFAIGPMLRARLGSPVWGVEIVGAYFVPREQSVATSGGSADVTYTLGYAGAALCPRLFATGRFALVACAGVDAGSLRVRGSGFLTATDSTDAEVFARAAARGSFSVAGPLFVATEIRVAVPFARERYVYQERDGSAPTLFRMPALAVAGNLTVGLVLE